MNSFNCSCSITNKCSILAVIISVIIGVITTVLTITAAITVTPAFLWVLFGIAVVYLLGVLVASPYIKISASKRCLCTVLPLLLLGILGTVITSVILLGITFAATSIAGAIITGLLLLFFFLVITSTICLVKCVADCDCMDN